MAEIFAERGGDPARTGKADPLDCLVWLAHREGEPMWPSSLGAGRPGWHIECTTIAMNLLQLPIDVQGGGSDLAFPHHDMCNMQAWALNGTPLAQSFVHAGMIGLDGEKMSKSRGNLVLVSQLLAAGTDPMAVRLALLAGHYRCDRDWSTSLLIDAESRLQRWRSSAHADATAVLAPVREALRNDLDTPTALRLLDDLAASSPQSQDGAVSLAQIADNLLGVSL
jgi:L-cysteine:1D-myo-inositol 2-amino-2-deoxy-alpha-D-glucopyranoside ligase